MIDTVIVAYRSEEVISDAVRAAQRLGGTVAVVDHGDGESAARAAALGATIIHDPTNPGFGAGQNRGVARTSSAYVLLCNPDAEIVPEAVQAGAALLERRADVAAVQGVVVNQATGAPERSAGVELRPVHLVGRAIGARRLLGHRWARAVARRSPVLSDHVERRPEDDAEVESLAATVVLVRRSAFLGVGGFDERYFLYGEDVDLCRRLRVAGWRLMAVPQVWARHDSGGSATSTVARELDWWRGTMRFAAIWWAPRAWAVAVAAAWMRWLRLAARHPSHAGPARRSLLVDPIRDRRRRLHPSATRATPVVAPGG